MKVNSFIILLFTIYIFTPSDQSNQQIVEIETKQSSHIVTVEEQFSNILKVPLEEYERKIFRESSGDPQAKAIRGNKIIASGLFQFTKTTCSELGMQGALHQYSEYDQHRWHLQFCKKWNWFDQVDSIDENERGFRLYLLGLAPSKYMQDLDSVLYDSGAAYSNNKNIDLIFGNGDGKITVQEVMNFYYG